MLANFNVLGEAAAAAAAAIGRDTGTGFEELEALTPMSERNSSRKKREGIGLAIMCVG